MADLKILTLIFSHSTSIGNPDGKIHLLATGGTSPYKYSIDNGYTWQASGNFEDLPAGDYIVKIKDDNDTEISGVTITLANLVYVDQSLEGDITEEDELNGTVIIQDEINAEIVEV